MATSGPAWPPVVYVLTWNSEPNGEPVASNLWPKMPEPEPSCSLLFQAMTKFPDESMAAARPDCGPAVYVLTRNSGGTCARATGVGRNKRTMSIKCRRMASLLMPICTPRHGENRVALPHAFHKRLGRRGTMRAACVKRSCSWVFSFSPPQAGGYTENASIERLRGEFRPWMARLERWRDANEAARRALRSREATPADPEGVAELRAMGLGGPRPAELRRLPGRSAEARR